MREAGDTQASVAGERLLLLPERAVFWESRGTLLVADPHWGKAATFRSAGLPVPGGGSEEDLRRLSHALLRTGARRLVVLGDLFHARQGRIARVLDRALAWRATHARVEMVLVTGNHDRHAGPPPPELGIRPEGDGLREPPFLLTHVPVPDPELYTLAGHLHPAVRARGPGRQRACLPCFWFGPRVGVLPAFGSFTGSAEVRPAPTDRIWGVAEDEVIELGGRTSNVES